MTDDFGIGIVEAEALQKLCHRAFLGFGSGIGRMAFLVQTALVADADAVGVVMLGMCSWHFLGTARVYLAIFGDVVVVADGAETTSLVTCFKVFNSKIAGDTGR